MATVWVVPISEIFYHWNIEDLVQKYILCISPSQLWFLCMLFEMFIFMWLLWKVICTNHIFGSIIVIFLFCLGSIGNKLFPNIFCIWNTCQYAPFFYFGIRIRLKEENGENIKIYQIPRIFWIVLDLFLFGVYMFTTIKTGIVIKIINVGLRFLLNVIGTIMAFVILQGVADFVDWKRSKFIKLLSAYSMPLYLFHQQIIYFVIIWLNGRVNPYLHACVNFILAFAGSFFISRFLMRYKVTRILIGEN